MDAPALEFCADTHTYTVDGLVRPNVTRVIAPLESWAGVPSSVLEYASRRGTLVHLATQLLDEDDLDEDTLDPALRPYLDAYRRFLEDARPEWSGIEMRVHHSDFGYCGTLDRCGVLHGLKGAPESVVDIKAVAKVSPATGVQTAAYDAALPQDRRRKKRHRYALQLKQDGTYRLHPFTERTDFDVFVSCLNLFAFKTRHGLNDQEIPA